MMYPSYLSPSKPVQGGASECALFDNYSTIPSTAMRRPILSTSVSVTRGVGGGDAFCLFFFFSLVEGLLIETIDRYERRKP